jgi:hypothetical protein
MPTIPEIVNCLRITRTEFANFFLQAQVNISVPVENRQTFEAVALNEADDRQAFIIALTHAQSEEWLDSLVDIFLYQGRESGELSKLLIPSVSDEKKKANLQAMIDIAQGFDQPDVIFKGFGNGMRWTGKIYVGGVSKGTGALISPNLLLTAWHVVKLLFHPDTQGKYQRNLINSGDLEIEFDDFLSLLERGQSLRPVKTIKISAYLGLNNTDDERKKWCLDFSPCHPNELSDQKPDPLEGFEGYWDYAIIKLEKPLGLERRWAVFDQRSMVPKESDNIVIFQHPAGQPLRASSGAITNITPPNPNVIPKMRFLHRANAVGGSSGGPCFDKSFSLFGLHQGEWADTGIGAAANRGIPLHSVIEHLKSNDNFPLPDLEASENLIWRLGGNQANALVIGCDDFQNLIWQSVFKGNPKIITISGERGRGKSFRIELIKTMLPEGGHLKIHLSAEDITSLSALDLAIRICREAGAQVPGGFADLDSINSTPAVWLRDELVPKVMTALNNVRNNRLVWLTISNLNLRDIKGDNSSEFLLHIYEQLRQVEWLRIVLDGMSGDVPISLNNVLRQYVVEAIALGDVETYLNRFFSEIRINLGGGALDALDFMLVSKYRQDVINDPTKAMRDLLSMVLNYCNRFM